jgi:small-conductance mechanosensitive channel
MRLLILRSVPIARLIIYTAAGIATVMILIEPTFGNVVALIASISLALAFALKDYVSCLVAGVTVVLESTYQFGDWIEVDGTYGEVKSIDARAVHLLTVDDTEVIIPHSRLWSVSIHNATSGNRSLLCVSDFFLHPDHDAAVIRQLLA